MQNSIYLDAPAHQAALSHHFGMPDTTIILSEVPIGRTVRQHQGLRVPDRAGRLRRRPRRRHRPARLLHRGAGQTAGLRAGSGVSDSPLAGDRLVDGVYQPIEVVQFGESSYRGHSAAGPGSLMGGRPAPLVRPGERPLPAHLRRGSREVWPESHWSGFTLRQADVLRSNMA